MTDSNQRTLAETVFEREDTAAREPSNALKLEEVRRAAAVENMRRLRAIRLARNANQAKEN